jgi:hypothetical protein
MQSIKIKFLPATNTKPARFKATCEAGSIIENIDNETSDQKLSLAFKLANIKFNWNVKEFSRGTYKSCEYFNIIK